MRIMNKKARIISGILAGVMLSSVTMSSGYGQIREFDRLTREPFVPADLFDGEKEDPVAVPYTPADEEAAVIQLGNAVKEKDSAEILASTDELTEYIRSELEKLDATAYTGNDPELKQRRETFEIQVRARAAEALAAVDRVRHGQAEDGDMELIEKTVYGDTAFHRSNAAANSATEIKEPESTEAATKAPSKETTAATAAATKEAAKTTAAPNTTAKAESKTTAAAKTTAKQENKTTATAASTKQADKTTAAAKTTAKQENKTTAAAASTKQADNTTVAAGTNIPSGNTGADYSEYLSAEIPESVADMAKELGSANEIYKYVRNSISYEAYAGSKKGALVTLEQLGGNDVDQSALLIQMLRTIGIPARFVKGHVQITADQAVAITGASDAESAGRILSARYKDVKSVTNNGTVTGYLMEHVWTEAYIPYTDYRGAGNMAGDPLWIPLDPAFKELNVESAEINDNFTENQAKVIKDAEELADKYPAMYREGYKDNGKTTIYARSIIENTDVYLPVTLPYDVLSVEERFADVSGTQAEDRLTVEINGETLLDKPLAELYYDQIIIHYVPAGETDRKLLEEYGTLTDVPAYMMKVVPELVLSRDISDPAAETVVVTGKKSQTLGTMQKMLTTVRNGGGTTILTDDVYCGSVYAINLDYQRITVGDADFAQARVKRAELEAENKDPLSPEIIGSFLDYAGKYYFALCDNDAAALEHVYNVQRNRQLGLAFTGYEFKTDDILGLTDTLKTGAFYIDAAYNNFSTVSFDGNKRSEICFNSAICASESLNEGNVWEVLTDDQLTGISTLKVFEAAAENDIPTPYIFQDDVEEQLETCTVSETVKNEVRDFVNQGYAVRLVSQNITIDTWTGTAYTVTDLRTGVTSYMLSDGTAGGKTLDFDMLFKINMVLFQVNLALSAVSLAQASFKIHCVSPSTVVGGALQAIDAGKAMGRAFQIYYDSVFWICDYATGDPAKLDEFRKFTVKNINETIDYMKALWNGCKFDALCGVASIGKLETLSKVLDIKTYALDTTDTLTSHLAPEQNYDDLDWLDEFSKNPYQIMLDQIMSLIGRFVH